MTPRMVTDDLVVPLNGKFRLQLINNFKLIDYRLRQLNQLYDSLPESVKSEDIDNLSKNINHDVQTALADMDKKINRITLGVDVETMERVVTKILEDKGVI